MSRESKILTCGKWEQMQTVNDYESFGWELLNATEDRLYISRETQNPVYSELQKYEIQYDAINAKIKEAERNEPIAPNKASVAFITLISIATILFFVLSIITSEVYAALITVALIIMLIIYIAVKVKKKNQYKEAMRIHKELLRVYREQQVIVCNNSRATFFAKLL